VDLKVQRALKLLKVLEVLAIRVDQVVQRVLYFPEVPSLQVVLHRRVVQLDLMVRLGQLFL